MEFENRLKEIRRISYKRLKEGLGTEKNRVIRSILKEARILLAEVEKMRANYDYAYDFIMEAEFALSDILWINELNEVVIEEPAVQEVEIVDDFGFEIEVIETEEATQEAEGVEVQEVINESTLYARIEAISTRRNEAIGTLNYEKVNNELLEAINQLRQYNIKRVSWGG